MDNRIGTCSICGGPVTLPNMMVHPVASCERCGAHPKHPHGPVIQMEPRQKVIPQITDEAIEAWRKGELR